MGGRRAARYRRINGIVARWVAAGPPTRYLNIDFIGAIRADLGGWVGKQPEYDIRVQLIELADDLPLQLAKAERLGGG